MSENPPTSRPTLTVEALPPIEYDLALLGRLQCSRQLSRGAVGFVLDALSEWAVLDRSCPDPIEPEGRHLEALEQVAARWAFRTGSTPTVSRMLGMAMIGRHLNQAVRCERDPEGMAESQWNELVARMPWVAEPPLPLVYPDGTVL